MISKTNTTSTFRKLEKNELFASIVTLYTKSNGAEDPKEHIFQRIGKNKGMLMPEKSIFVHFVGDEKVVPCVIENTKIAIK